MVVFRPHSGREAARVGAETFGFARSLSASHSESSRMILPKDSECHLPCESPNAIAHRPVEAEGRNGSGGATVCAAKGSE